MRARLSSSAPLMPEEQLSERLLPSAHSHCCLGQGYMSGHGGLFRYIWSQSSSKFVTLIPKLVKVHISDTKVCQSLSEFLCSMPTSVKNHQKASERLLNFVSVCQPIDNTSSYRGARKHVSCSSRRHIILW